MVRSRNLVNEEAMAHWALLGQIKKNVVTVTADLHRDLINCLFKSPENPFFVLVVNISR